MTRDENHVELTMLRASDAAQRARIAALEAEVERLKDELRATYPPPHSPNCGCRVCILAAYRDEVRRSAVLDCARKAEGWAEQRLPTGWSDALLAFAAKLREEAK